MLSRTGSAGCQPALARYSASEKPPSWRRSRCFMASKVNGIGSRNLSEKVPCRGGLYPPSFRRSPWNGRMQWAHAMGACNAPLRAEMGFSNKLIAAAYGCLAGSRCTISGIINKRRSQSGSTGKHFISTAGNYKSTGMTVLCQRQRPKTLPITRPAIIPGCHRLGWQGLL
jgi:hypothetical protein